MRVLRRVIPVAGLVVVLTVLAVGLTGPAEAPALAPVPEYVTFVHHGALEQVLAGDTAALVLVDPATLPAEEPGFPAPLEVVAHWWAPDGTHVMVGARSSVTGAQRLFICDHTGGNPVPVTVASGLFVERGGAARSLWDNPMPVWSADGRHVALTVFDGSTPFGDIYVAALDGTGDIVGSGVEPTWSPDGTRIAYVRVVPEAATLAEARPYISVGTIGGGSVDLGIGRAPVFSPDGSEVLYRTWSESGSEGGDPEQLAITPAGGGATRTLTAYGPMDDMGGPSAILDHGYSPDGERVYFILGRRSDSRFVFEVAADGSSAPSAVSGLASEYVLSLDGSRLVYTGGDVSEASFQTRQQVFARDLASCAEWQLTSDELADHTCSNLSVSNQDRYVAFEAALVPTAGVPADATTREVWVATLDGSHAWRCATDGWDVASQPAYGGSAATDDGVSTDDFGPMDDEYDPTRRGFFQTIGDAIGALLEWLAGLFD